MPKEDKFEATKICHELLKANGVYITFENVRPSTEDSVRIGMDYWKNFQLSRGRDAEIVERHLKRFDVEYFPIKIDEHISLLKKTGFKVVEMFWKSYLQAGFYCIK
jgi:tRNA (cmo5U34)-methyltransferase